MSVASGDGRRVDAIVKKRIKKSLSARADGHKALPGLTEDETRYFQWLLCKNLGQINEKQWQDLTKLNQKTLAAMS